MYRVSLLLTFILSIGCLLAVTPTQASPLHILADHPSGIYDTSENVVWTVIRERSDLEARYVLKRNGVHILEAGNLEFSGDRAIVEASSGDPGVLIIEVDWLNKEGTEEKTVGGVVFSLREIEPSRERPRDFDAFWDAKIDQLERVPENANLEKVDIAESEVDYWKLSMDGINDSQIQGQLARPSEGDKLPAILILQWAGVYPLKKEWVVDRAQEGWLALNIMAHDLPIDHPKSFYAWQKEGPLSAYQAIGAEDREKSYFLRMLLSCYRAASYLSSRDDWNGETLLVTGGSQGGYQALATAALHPAVTAAAVNVPAGCDFTGKLSGRRNAWPAYAWSGEEFDAQKVNEAIAYFDVANFAPRIECPVLVGVGLIDTVCPPEGIFAVVNQIESPVELAVLYRGAHQAKGGSHNLYLQRFSDYWLPTLRQGEALSVLDTKFNILEL